MLSTLFASIPSPSNGVFYLGPVPLRLYGLTLAVGVIAAVYVAEWRWKRMGHDPKEISSIAVWVVIAGVIGARVYHVVTDYQLYTDNPLGVFEIWSGGLAIWGAVAGGAIAVVILSRRHHFDTLAVLDAIAPGVILAQGIGRWGNYFNQELFGRPTTLPWGLEIDVAQRPAQYVDFATFHPTFLYESLWCFLIFGVLIAADRIRTHRRGQTIALYIALYTLGRFVFENLRSDPAHVIAGMRINAWVSIAVFVGATVWFVWLGRRPQPATRSDTGARDEGVGRSRGGGRVASDQ